MNAPFSSTFAVRQATQAEINAARNARCPEDLDWADLGGIMNEGGQVATFLGAEWNTRHIYRDHTTQPPPSKLIRLACAFRELVKALDAEESGE